MVQRLAGAGDHVALGKLRHEAWWAGQGAEPQELLFSLWPVCVCAQLLSRVQLVVIPWTVAYQDPLSMEFSRQENWSGLPCSPPRHLPIPEIEPRSTELQVDSLLSESTKKFSGLVAAKLFSSLVCELLWASVSPFAQGRD